MNLIFEISKWGRQHLNITGHFTLYYIEKLVSTGSQFLATFCCLISCIGWMSLNYKACFRHVQKVKYYLC